MGRAKADVCHPNAGAPRAWPAPTSTRPLADGLMPDRPDLCVWAPGRVNLIGEHIDYCGGTVLPMPIQLGTRLDVAARRDDRVRVFSARMNEAVEVGADTEPFPPGHWGNFVRGAVELVLRAGAERVGADVRVESDISASGLSSSASFAVGLLSALGAVANVSLQGLALARMARRLEHEYAGVPCGLMDQAAIVLCPPGCALAFDCATEHGTPVELRGPHPAILVVDSGKPRELAASAYRTRFDETARVAQALGVRHDALASVPPERLDAADVDAVARRRARHVIDEHLRVGEAIAAIEAGDWPRLGTLFLRSHDSLRTLYDVSCAELGALVELVTDMHGAFGARMTGAGFGGAIVALVAEDALDGIGTEVCDRFASRFGHLPATFVAHSMGGVTVSRD